MTDQELGPGERGRIVGQLAAGEDRPAIEIALRQARRRVLAGELALLLHADHRPEVPGEVRARQQTERLTRLAAGRLKRFVFRLETRAGPRIVKISEVVSLGNRLSGLLGSSNARREHQYQAQAQTLGLAATETKGYLELREGPWLRRACQIQTVLDGDRPTLDSFLAEEYPRFGDEAIVRLAEAFAQTHRRRFFHGDLKGFHAFPTNLQRPPEQAASYELQWLDLGRVGFRLSRRQRIINLYQMFRFVLPQTPEVQANFIQAYCRHTGWWAHRPKRALARVRRFLQHKLRTHPDPFL